ncbi:MAG: ABC transporter substrate-binding protein [Clostridiales bacterium]|nr:ABC transporter substrate-binding protein [Clostridiales bacterium]
MSKKLVSLFLVLLMIFSMATVMAESNTITVTDMFGREVTIEGPVSRVIAIEPSDCEILCAIGCEDSLVGRGEYCDYPASVLELPSVQSGWNTNLEEVLALNPQVVILSDMNDTPEMVELLENNGVCVIVTDPNSIEDVYINIRLLGAVMGKEAEAEAVIADMQATFADIAAKSGKTDKTIYFEVMPLEWGLWSAGANTFMHELAEICGMKNAFADIEGWQQVSQEQVIERSPDYIVLVTGMGETAVDEVMGREGWETITAIKNGAVYNADSYAMTRPAPRLAEAVVGLYNFLNGITQ